jgi:hypothetical protein
MATDENVEVVEEVEAPVIVEVDDSEEAPDVDTGDTTVVVSTDSGNDDDSMSQDEAQRWIDLEAWKAQTAADIQFAINEAIDARIAANEAQAEAEIAEVVAEVAIDETEEVEVDVEEIEDAIAPETSKPHWLFASGSDLGERWRNRKQR